MERKFILLSNFLKRRRINNVSDWILKLKFKSANEVNQWCKSNGINNDLSLKSLFKTPKKKEKKPQKQVEVVKQVISTNTEEVTPTATKPKKVLKQKQNTLKKNEQSEKEKIKLD